MKISYLSNSCLDKGAANAVHVMKMCAALSKHGNDVTLHARVTESEVDECFDSYGVSPNFEICAAVQPSVRFIGPILYGLRQALNARFKYHSDICYARCLISAYIAILFGMRVIVEFHEIPHNAPLIFLMRRIINSGKLERGIAISHRLLDDIYADYPAAHRYRWQVAHDGADVPVAKSALGDEPSQELVIGYAGGMREGNGIELMVKLAERFADYSFHFVGGSKREIERWSAFQRSANIKWYGRQKAHTVPAFLSSCDILLAPYQHGPKTNAGRDTSRWMSPLKIFEYMASGRPMIVSDFPVLREVLDERFAMLVAPEDFDGWVWSLEQLIGDDTLRQCMGSAAKEVLCEKYTWEKRAEDVLAELKR